MSGAHASPYPPHATASDVLARLDVRGKAILLTGGTDGLGLETTRALAKAGAHVTFTTRNPARGRQVADLLRAETPGVHVEPMLCDLMAFESVDAFCEEVSGRAPRIDALILNAGILAPGLVRNARGVESHLMTNVVGHAMIAAAVAPALIAAAPSRIVSLTSCAHKSSPFLIDDPNFERHPYDQLLAYAHTKTACALMAVELNRRLSARGVLAFAVHPGSIFETGLAAHTRPDNTPEAIEQQAAAMNLLPQDRKTLQQGAATSVYAAVDPALGATGGGLYLEDVRVGVTSEDPYPFRNVAPHALDPNAAAEMWAVVESIVGRKLVV